jgi:hypothetical protein
VLLSKGLMMRASDMAPSRLGFRALASCVEVWRHYSPN